MSNSYVMTGLDSYHDNGKEDRRFRITCKGTQGVRSMSSHVLTGYQNNWDGVLSYYPAASDFIVGMYSVHDNGKEDRLFRFYTRQLCKTMSSEIAAAEQQIAQEDTTINSLTQEKAGCLGSR